MKIHFKDMAKEIMANIKNNAFADITWEISADEFKNTSKKKDTKKNPEDIGQEFVIFCANNIINDNFHNNWVD